MEEKMFHLNTKQKFGGKGAELDPWFEKEHKWYSNHIFGMPTVMKNSVEVGKFDPPKSIQLN